jgi:predicted enzyme related to lactoylglutathione lyase
MSEQEQVVEEKMVEEPLLKAVNCIYIPVSDPHKAADWYEKYLGLSRVSPGGDVMLLGNGIWMFLSKGQQGQTSHFMGLDGSEVCSFTFETEDIVALHQSLTNSGAFVEPVEDFGNCGFKFWFKDPDGNRFHIWQDPNKAI